MFKYVLFIFYIECESMNVIWYALSISILQNDDIYGKTKLVLYEYVNVDLWELLDWMYEMLIGENKLLSILQQKSTNQIPLCQNLI